MADGNVDRRKRRFLLAATSVAGGVAGVAVAVPFVASMIPSARARAAGAPVEVDISKIEPGMMMTVEWRGQPVWIVHRTSEMIDSLPKLDALVADPKSSMPHAAGLRKERSPFAQAGVPGAGRHLHAPRLFAVAEARSPEPKAVWARIGRAVSSVPATAPSSTLPAASTRTCRPRPTWRCRRIRT